MHLCKKAVWSAFIFALSLAVSGCKEKDTPIGEVVITGDAFEITEWTAVLEGFAKESPLPSGKMTCGFLLAADRVPTWKDHDWEFSSDAKDFPCTYTVKVSYLKSSTTYYYRACADFAGGRFLGEAKSFTTKSADASVATMDPVPMVKAVGMCGTLAFENRDSGIPCTVGFWLGDNPDPDILRTSTDFREASLGEDGRFFEDYVYDLEGGRTYYCMAGAAINGEYIHGEVKPVKAVNFAPSEGDFIDMGLSVKWASCNLGASSPASTGGYYAWGEKEPKEDYSYGTYSYDIQDNLILPHADDAAFVHYDGAARMPTYVEFKELDDNSARSWGEYDGMVGLLLVSRKNAETIFLPASGFMSSQECKEYKEYGSYWTSTRPVIGYNVIFFKFNTSSHREFYNTSHRYEGFQIRPVSDL